MTELKTTAVSSCDIGQALYVNNWYEQPQKVKKMLIIMKMRCNRSLGLEIGPFAIMSLNTFIGILKGAYSYMMLFYKSVTFCVLLALNSKG
ncbi:hypothetical protein NQ317_013832 [Molorchus minor]|uniref:Odorant receptor n=1 Tax=Molorchus minor TaxID=1323400 RepID=A0ABQ9IYD5_9CUCU|nr:hypothetical protein NQ317_013832 [Molorchus minor]